MSKNERADMKCPSNSRVDFLFFSLIQARLKLMACWRIKKKEKENKGREREREREQRELNCSLEEVRVYGD